MRQVFSRLIEPSDEPKIYMPHLFDSVDLRGGVESEMLRTTPLFVGEWVWQRFEFPEKYMTAFKRFAELHFPYSKPLEDLDFRLSISKFYESEHEYTTEILEQFYRSAKDGLPHSVEDAWPEIFALAFHPDRLKKIDRRIALYTWDNNRSVPSDEYTSRVVEMETYPVRNFEAHFIASEYTDQDEMTLREYMACVLSVFHEELCNEILPRLEEEARIASIPEPIKPDL